MLENIKPLSLSNPREAMISAHSYLRELIHNQILPPGAIISQVELSQALGVSRTPLREALRRLQEEGLIEAETNRRCRVSAYKPEDLDSTYGTRLLVETLALRISLPLLQRDDLVELESLYLQMDKIIKAARAAGGRGYSETWQELHHKFHSKLVAKAPPTLLEQYEALVSRCRRYFVGLVTGRQFVNLDRNDEHLEILNLLKAGEFAQTVIVTAKYRSRTAITLLADVAVDFEPIAIRSALRLVTGEADLRASKRKVA